VVPRAVHDGHYCPIEVSPGVWCKAVSHGSAVRGTVLAISGLTEPSILDEIAQDHQARRFAKPEEPRGLMRMQREFGISA
jgi:hypothetical protein